jgi:hypothetical protein
MQGGRPKKVLPLFSGYQSTIQGSQQAGDLMAARGKAWLQSEDDVIRLLLAKGKSYRQIASVLGRGKSSVCLRVKRMNTENSLGQGVLNIGQIDE